MAEESVLYLVYFYGKRGLRKGVFCMAVTAPTPPIPPTPPQVSKVILQEGGTVKETSIPQSHGPQSDEERNEAKARESVADGNGALSKTTVGGTQAKKNGQEKQEEKPASSPSVGSVSSVKEIDTEERDAQIEALLKESKKEQGQEKQTEVKQPVSDAHGEHGPVYWGFSLVSAVAMVVMLYKHFLVKKERKEVPVQDETELRPGMTAGQVLREMEKQESVRHVAPPTAAKEYAVQSSVKPASQIAEDQGGAGASAKPARIARKEVKKSEDGHFEVRI